MHITLEPEGVHLCFFPGEKKRHTQSQRLNENLKRNTCPNLERGTTRAGHLGVSGVREGDRCSLQGLSPIFATVPWAQNGPAPSRPLSCSGHHSVLENSISLLNSFPRNSWTTSPLNRRRGSYATQECGQGEPSPANTYLITCLENVAYSFLLPSALIWTLSMRWRPCEPCETLFLQEPDGWFC